MSKIEQGKNVTMTYITGTKLVIDGGYPEK